MHTTFMVAVVALSPHVRILEEGLTIYSSPVLFFKWKAARAHQFHSLAQDQPTVAQRTETTVAEGFLTSCV